MSGENLQSIRTIPTKTELHIKESKSRSEDLNEILCILQRYLAKKHNILPGLVLAVIGDSESYVPKPWNTTAFTSGLFASCTRSQKITTDIQSAKENQIEMTHGNTLIAIKPLTDTYEEDDNNVAKPDLLFTLKPVFEDSQTQTKYRWFNHYLSHFLEKLSAEYTPLLSDERELVLINMRVPVLMIAVEGDTSSIHQIKSAVKRNIPVLLVKGSGKAVDFIIEYLESQDQYSTDDQNDKGKSTARTVTMNNVETERRISS
ncbi:unnamed protein product [Mytilus edulis]|uniref:TRPM SLOG domain-containing protein n=1 Tax=Mytilus edulis TaxID=6550 RepID=A0A8S3THD9_MYTED|nr:unnamed protein product [Mytilus edulis]